MSTIFTFSQLNVKDRQMLLEFKCSNFRSFKGEETLSMLPVKAYKEYSDNLINAKLANRGDIDVLAAVALYGPNASGKTNFLNAMKFAQTLIVANASPDKFGTHGSFVGNDEKDTSFSFLLLVDGVRFLYEFSISSAGITYEHLSAKPRSERLVFERRLSDDGLYELKVGSRYSGIKTRLRGYMDNGLVLGLLSKFDIGDCKRVYDWFAQGLSIIIGDKPIDYGMMLEKLKNLGEDNFVMAMKKVKTADLGITGAQLAVRNLTEEERDRHKIISDRVKTVFEVLSGEELDDIPEPDKKIVFQFQHSIGGKEVGFGFENESLGTVMMLNLAADFIDALSKGKTLVIDEIERSIHPMLLRSLISMFFDQSLNTRGAQLIFTTHDLSFMDNEMMRRDQLWFVDKDGESGASELYSLAEFSPRKDDSILNRYKYGAYGAVPYVEEVL